MWRKSSNGTDEEHSVYDRNRYLTGAAIAAIIAFLAYFFMNGDKIPTVQKEEADIIVIDPTADGAAWRDARANVIDRIAHAFGQTTVSGTIVGSGATGNITIVPVGRDTNNSDSISVLSYQDLANLRTLLYGNSVAPRAIDTYDQLLSGDSPSLWKYLVENQISNPSALSSVSSSNCKSLALGEIQNRKSNPDSSQKFSSVMDDIASNGIDASELAESMCNQITKVSQSIGKADQIMAGKLHSCQEVENGERVACSDILGATRVINTLMTDFAKSIDKSLSGTTPIQLNACTIYASDMMHYDNEGPLQIRKWDSDSDNGEEAAMQGQTASIRYLGSSGYPLLSGGSEVYMPYLGNLTYRKKRTIHELNELKFFWESFFKQAGSEPIQGSTRFACTGNEAHITR